MHKLQPSSRHEEQREDNAINSPVEMGIVVDIIASAAALVVGIGQVEKAEDETRYTHGNEHHVDFIQWRKNNPSKQHRGHAARSAQAAIVAVIAVAEVGGDIGYDNAAQVEQQKAPDAAHDAEAIE